MQARGEKTRCFGRATVINYFLRIALTRLSSGAVCVQYHCNLPQCGTGRGEMDELVERLVANVGVSRTAAEQSIGIILDFLKTEGPPDKVQALLDKLPGSEAYLQSADAAGDGGMFMSGIMGAGTRMMSAGLSMDQVQAVTRETIAYVREKAGEDAIGEIVGAIPGLGQFI